MSSTTLAVKSRVPSGRTTLLGVASAVLAVASVGVTLAVTSGGDDPEASRAPAGLSPSLPEPHAHPLERPEPGERAAERFHHYR